MGLGGGESMFVLFHPGKERSEMGRGEREKGKEEGMDDMLAQHWNRVERNIHAG